METTLYIQNLKCGGCANTITKNLTTLEGIQNITVNVELLDNIKHMNALDGTNLNSLINGIVIEAVSADGSILTGNLSIVINDDLISIDPVSTSGVNSSTAANIVGALNIIGADGNDHTLDDTRQIQTLCQRQFFCFY